MSIESLSVLLDTGTVFSVLPVEMRQRIASLLLERKLSAGQILAEQDQAGDRLYLVVEGSIELTRLPKGSETSVHLGLAGPGTMIGELDVFTRQPRAATMTAATPSTVAGLFRADFDLLCLKYPQEMESVIAWMRQRLHAYQIRSAIDQSLLFRHLSAEAKSELESSFQWTMVQAGETLFREGDPGDALYLITNGRIELFQSKDPSSAGVNPFWAQHEDKLAELGKGDTFGEMALLTSSPRSATAYAVRDSQLARLDRSSFDKIIDAFPKEVLRATISQMAERLREQNRGGNIQDSPPSSIAVLSLTSLAGSFACELAKSLSPFGATLHLTRKSLPPLVGLPAVEGTESRLLSWLNDQESTYRQVVYETDGKKDAWSLRCLRQADILFAIVDAEEDCDAVVGRLNHLKQQLGHPIATHLVFFHPKGSAFPKNTRKWLNCTEASGHWHIRAENSDDVSRVARFLAGRSVGVALGGGFAYGLAHIGVIQALREMQIPIDYIGGTSIGAIVAAAFALGFSREQMLEVLEKGCAHSLKGDFTLPIISLLTGKKVAHSLGTYLENVDIEDFWLPYFAISASLVHATMVVHTSGDALRSTLASSRAPGIFPPLGWDGDVLVDGGLVNNVPSDVMRSKIGSGTVIAVDVSPEVDFSVAEQFDMYLSGWKMARIKANPFARKQKGTTIAGIFARLVRFGGVAQGKQIRATADLYLIPPLEKFTFRDFSCGEEMSQVGYEHTRAEMERWIDQHGRPWLGSPQNQGYS